MRAPDQLGAAGKGAWRRAVRAIGDVDDPDRFYDLAARYAHAVDLADRARREWRRAGTPLVLELGNGTATVHPLVKLTQEAERDAKRFGEALEIKPGRRSHRGPNPKAVIEADIGPSPAARLRAVK